MANSRSKKEIIKALALKMDTDEKTAGQWLRWGF
jgi:hypothetical protein